MLTVLVGVFVGNIQHDKGRAQMDINKPSS